MKYSIICLALDGSLWILLTRSLATCGWVSAIILTIKSINMHVTYTQQYREAP